MCALMVLIAVIQLHFLGVLLVFGFAAQVFELVQRRLFAAQYL